MPLFPPFCPLLPRLGGNQPSHGPHSETGAHFAPAAASALGQTAILGLSRLRAAPPLRRQRGGTDCCSSSPPVRQEESGPCRSSTVFRAVPGRAWRQGPVGTARAGARTPGGRRGAARRRPGGRRKGREAVAAIMRALPGLGRLLAARGWGWPPRRCLSAMARYGTEQRGRPNTPDYRLYFSK